jgi:hypothetical protein
MAVSKNEKKKAKRKAKRIFIVAEYSDILTPVWIIPCSRVVPVKFLFPHLLDPSLLL